MIILRVTNDKSEVFDLIPLEDIDLRLDISAIENTEIGVSFGISSQEFAIAGDNNSNQFFGNLYDLGATPAVALMNSVECQVLSDGQEVFTGKLYIRDVITNQQGYTIYNTVVVNETIDFKYRIQNLALNDPRFDFSAYDHNFTAANVTGSWSNNLFSGSIVYPNIHYGNDGNPDCPNYAFAGLNTAAALENTIDNFDSPLRLKDFKPTIKVRDVIDVIFSGSYSSGSTGYQYTSSFFESAYFNDLYLLTTANDALGPANTNPISQSAWVFRSGSTQTFTDGVEGNIDFNSASYDNSGNYNLGTDRYTADENGTYTFTGQISYTISSFAADPQMNVVIRVKKIVGITETVLETFTRFNLYATGNSLLFQGRYDLNAGDQIRVTALFSDPVGAGKTMVLQPGLVQTFLQVRGPTTIEGSNVNMSQQFPDDLKALDFIQAIIEKFNLVVEPVPNKKNLLSIEPYDTWFDSGEQINWTNKVDRDVNFQISSPVIEQPRTIIFSDLDDKDYLNLYTNEVFNKTYGEYVYTSDSDLAEGERKIGKIFAPTPTTNIPNSTAFIIPHLCTKPVNSDSIYKPMAFKPRLLYGIGIQNVESAAAGFSGSAFQTASYWLKDELNNVTRQSTWYQVSSLTETPISGAAFDLHFNNNNQGAGAIPPYWSNVSPNNFISGSGDAFTTYWANYINGLYDIDARKLICNVYLTPSEISGIRLNQKIFIDGAYYRINRINGANLTRRDTIEVEFIKVIARKLTFPRRRIINSITGVTRDVQFQGQNPNGGGIYNDFETGLVVNDFDIISQAGPLDGLRVFPIGAGGATGSAVWNYSEPTIPILAQTSLGTNTVSADSSKILTVGSKNSVGSAVSTATALGQFNTIEQNVTNAFVIGQQNTIGETSQNTQILGGTGNTISGSNNVNMTIVSSTGSILSNSDYSTMINGNSATILDSDFTTAINSHQNEVIVNGSGHTVIGLNREGAGLDLLNTRNNSNFLGDTYIGGGYLVDSFTKNIGDGTNIFLTGSSYGNGKHETLYILNWSGLSPGTASINLPSAANSDYKGVIYTFKLASGNAGEIVNIIPFTSSQTIDGATSYQTSGSYAFVSIHASGSKWHVIDSSAGGGGTPGPSGSAFPFTGSAQITGSLSVTGSITATAGFTGSLLGTASFATLASCSEDIKVVNSDQPGASEIYYYTSVQNTGSICQDLNTLDTFGLHYESNTNTHTLDTPFTVSGSTRITGSLSVTGSITSPVVALTASAGTASMDLAKGNAFSITLTTSSATFITATNIVPNQHISLLVNQSASGVTGTGNLFFTGSVFFFPSGGEYTTTFATGSKDVLTFETFTFNPPILANTTINYNLVSASNGPPIVTTFMSASGGQEFLSGSFRIHKFTGSANLTVHSLGNFDPGEYEYLIVAGGGGGSGGISGTSYGSGGGSGTARTGSTTFATTGSFTATVGGGGAGSAIDVAGSPGANSSFNSIVAISGSGAGTGIGGDNADFLGASRSGLLGGGGAGAAQAGTSGGTTGQGGNGIQSAISGSSIFYGGGGGGGRSGGGNGGSGGGGAGSDTAGSNGTNALGGGGGGSGNFNNGGNGGSGVVIIKYQYQA